MRTPDFYRPTDLIEILKIDRSTVYRWINEPDFPKVRKGKLIFIPVKAFENWMQKDLQGGKS